MDKERLKEIVETRTLTAEDKAALMEMCDTYGIGRPTNTRCKNCYLDKAVELWKRMTEQEQPKGDDTRRYRLKRGSVVVFGGMLLTDEGMTDEMAERLIGLGLSTEVFEK